MNPVRTALFILLALPATGVAESVQSTTGVHLSFRDCVPGETACDSISRAIANGYGGLPGDTRAQVDMILPDHGDGSGLVEIDLERGMFNMRAAVNTLAGTRNGSNNYLAFRYTNESGQAQMLEIRGELNFSQQVPADNAPLNPDHPSGTVALAYVGVMDLDIEAVEAGTTARDNLAFLQAEPPDGVWQNPIADALAKSPVSFNGNGNAKLSTSASLAPGGTVWIWSLLQCIAAKGAAVTANFDAVMTVAADTAASAD